MIKINLGSPVPIYEQLVEEISSSIDCGNLKPNESLPSIRSLANQLDVAANTVARAYQELERKGLIKKYGTKGTFVLDQLSRNDPGKNSLFKEQILLLLQHGNNKDQIRQIFDNEFNKIFGN